MTTKLIGYHATLPIQPGQTVLIPAGTKVRTMHPSRSHYVTKRAQKVKVNHTLPGCSLAYSMIGERDARAHGIDLAKMKVLRETDFPAYMTGAHPVSNPSVRWPGTGGYWCEVDINDVQVAA